MSKNVQKPYMDEIFHYGQTESYLKGNYAYDPKITTPPALYFINVMIINMLSTFYIRFENNLIVERFINTFIYGNLSIIILYKINQKIYPDQSQINMLKSILFILYPTNYFFMYLYYTDVSSIFFILMSVYTLLEDYKLIFALTSLISIFIRQTNLVWIVYICIWHYLKQKKNHFQNQDARNTLTTQLNILYHLLTHDYHYILRQYGFQIVLSILSIIFAIYNKGVALGDQENHAPVFHPTQMLYLFFFSILFLPISWKNILYYINLALNYIYNNANGRIYFVCSSMLFMIIVHKFTYIHEFILSDNRHFTFYIYRYFFQKYLWFKYILCPIYSICFFYLSTIFISSSDKLLVFCLWIFSSSLVLIPSKLIEFRYFTIPLLFLNLEINEKKSRSNLKINILCCIIANLVLFYIFLHPVHCINNDELCRFMF